MSNKTITINADFATGEVTYQCPVCEFAMDDPPEHYNICECCKTEFGLHDVNSSIEVLREVFRAERTQG